MPCLANALFGQCPMPYALCQIVPHLFEKGYIYFYLLLLVATNSIADYNFYSFYF